MPVTEVQTFALALTVRQQKLSLILKTQFSPRKMSLSWKEEKEKSPLTLLVLLFSPVSAAGGADAGPSCTPLCWIRYKHQGMHGPQCQRHHTLRYPSHGFYIPAQVFPVFWVTFSTIWEESWLTQSHMFSVYLIFLISISRASASILKLQVTKPKSLLRQLSPQNLRHFC